MCRWYLVGDISTLFISRTLLHTNTTLKRRNIRFMGKGERPYIASLTIVIKCEFLSRGKPVPSKGLVVVEGSPIYHFFPTHAPSISGSISIIWSSLEIRLPSVNNLYYFPQTIDHDLKNIFRKCGKEFIAFPALYQLLGGENGDCNENGKRPIASPCLAQTTSRKSNVSVENKLKDAGERMNENSTFQMKVKEEQERKENSERNKKELLNKMARKGRKDDNLRLFQKVSKHIKGSVEYRVQGNMKK